MSEKYDRWDEYRRRKLEKLEIAKAKGEVDEWIIPILHRINSLKSYVTLSSCAGRLAVMDMPDFGNKKESIFLGKWHTIPDPDVVRKAIESGKKTTWLMLQPPIIHIACKNKVYAEKLINLAQIAGIRRACIISLRRMVVEVCGHERMEIPVRFEKFLPVDLDSVLKIAEMKLERSRKKFINFSKILEDLIIPNNL
jgi:tRNA wybutosine-synthesizing protein 3